MKDATCGSCRHYIGGGDWNLCCDMKYELCYKTTLACEDYGYSAEKIAELEERQRKLAEFLRAEKARQLAKRKIDWVPVMSPDTWETVCVTGYECTGCGFVGIVRYGECPNCHGKWEQKDDDGFDYRALESDDCE